MIYTNSSIETSIGKLKKYIAWVGILCGFLFIRKFSTVFCRIINQTVSREI